MLWVVVVVVVVLLLLFVLLLFFLGGIWYCYKCNAEKLRDIFEFSITGRFSMTVIRNFVRF